MPPSGASSTYARKALTDGDVYVFTLQTAYLDDLLRHAPPRPEPIAPSRPSSERSERSALSDKLKDLRLHATSSGQAWRVPDKLVRKLSDQLGQIAMGRDPLYQQPSFRQTMGAFYGILQDDATAKRLRESRIETLLLEFTMFAQAQLRKRLPTEADVQAELDVETDLFVRVVHDVLRTIPGVSRDLTDYVSRYMARDVERPRSSAERRRTDTPDDVAASPLVAATGRLFHFSDAQVRLDVQTLSQTCTLSEAVIDVKRCIYHIHAQRAWPGCPDDFSTPEAYRQWRSSELMQLSKLVADICAVRPDLMKASVTSDSSSRRSLDMQDDVDDAFTYIPPDPCAAYERLLDICMDFDLDAIQRKDAQDDVPLSVLAPEHEDLLRLCATRWRVSTALARIAHLRLCRNKYDAGHVPLECVAASLESLSVHMQQVPPALWRRADQARLAQHLGLLADSLVRSVHTDLAQLETPSESVVALLDRVSQLAGDAHVVAVRVAPLRRAFGQAATRAYAAKAEGVFRVQTNIVRGFAELLDWLERLIETHRRQLRPVPGLATSDELAKVCVPLFLADLASVKEAVVLQVRQSGDLERVNEALALCQRVRAWQRSCDDDAFDACAYFRPCVVLWLELSEARTAEWIRSAVQHDALHVSDTTTHSTSVQDMLDALQQPLAFLESLAWADETDLAALLSLLAGSYERHIALYCHLMADRYMLDMRPPSLPEASSDAPLWVVRAKQAVLPSEQQMRSAVRPFVLQPHSCVILNNMEAARQLLDTLYRRMEADTQAERLRGTTADVPRSMVFSVKIVQAELPVLDVPRLDTLVTLSDARGTRLGKTRTLYDTRVPRWDEVVDIDCPTAQWISATVWRRSLHGEPHLLGRASVYLDPRVFGDVPTHDVWLTLDRAGGKLLLRVSMDEAHDGILYTFGRAFRTVKRTEADMTRVLVDHISLYMRHVLSRPVLAALVRGRRVDRALRALHAGARAPLTDHDMEEAIAPLFDYLDETLGTLHSSLSASQAQLVLSRVWKEVLVTLEGLLVPPLSDAPTDMQQLSDKEVDVVFRWLSFLRNYFHAYDAETDTVHGLPLSSLQSTKYRELVSYLLLHDQSTDALMIECVRGFQARLVKAPSRAKSVLYQRSLGTIGQHKRAKQQRASLADAGDGDACLMAMRILRMRPGTGDFLSQQLTSLHTLPSS